MLQNELEKVKKEEQIKNDAINQDVLDMQSILKDYEWFAYIGHANRKKEVNAWETELESLRIQKLVLEKQISARIGDYQQAIDDLNEVDLKLLSTPVLLARAKMRVESSYEYFKMTTGKISRMDYETWILGNRKVPLGDDENYVRDITIQYKKNHIESNENIQSGKNK